MLECINYFVKNYWSLPMFATSFWSGIVYQNCWEFQEIVFLTEHTGVDYESDHLSCWTWEEFKSLDRNAAQADALDLWEASTGIYH